MTADDLQTYFIANLNACIASRSSIAVPLTAIGADQIYTRNYELPAKACTIFIDPEEETSEPLTMNTRVIRCPMKLQVFVQGATEAQLRLRATGYMYAILDCIGAHPDFMNIETRTAFDGVEGKEDIKAAEVLAIFEYEEAI